MAETNKQKLDRVEKRGYWQEHIERWTESSLTASRYCREHVLSLGQFKYWQERLTQVQSPLFVELETRSYQAYEMPASTRTILIETPKGIKITLKTNELPSDMACLLQLLSAHPC